MKKTDEEKREKFSVPKVINTDLTYYMQFGWKRLKRGHQVGLNQQVNS